MKNVAETNLIVHPQAENIRRQNRQLQTELARLIVERDELQYAIAPQIAAEYQIKLGALEWRVFQLDCEMRAFVRRIEMAQSSLNRGEEPNYKRIEAEIKTEFAAWREQIKQREREIEAAQERENAPTLNRAESRELHTLYRKLAFALHPDILKNPAERQRKFWLRVAEAYKNGDLRTLRIVRLLIGDESAEISSDDANLSVLEILKNRNTELKSSCEKLLDEIAEIYSTTPYIWWEILDDETELERRQNVLREQIETLREQRDELVKNWAEIMRFAEDRDDVSIPDEPPDIFADNEDWAEIIYPL